MTPTKAVVLAHPRQALKSATRGSRFVRESLPPAPLLPVANRPLLAHALDWLAQSGVREAMVIAPCELTEPVRHAASGACNGLDVSWREQLPDETLSCSLGQLGEFIDGDSFVLHSADSVSKQSLSSLTEGADGAEAVFIEENTGGGELGQVIDLHRNGSRPRPGFAGNAAGVAVLSAEAIEVARSLDDPSDHVAETLAGVIGDRGGSVRTRPVHDWWRFRGGGTDALLEGNRFALEGQTADFERAEIVNSKIQGPVVAHPLARIESSIVRGPAVIGARAHLRNAYVGPYTSIGDDVIVEGAEVEYSVILSGASISYLGGRLEASVLGQGSKVSRDFRLPRALRLTVGEGAEVSLT